MNFIDIITVQHWLGFFFWSGLTVLVWFFMWWLVEHIHPIKHLGEHK